MNLFAFVGNATRDCEITTTQNGTDIATFTLAINKYGKDEADFIRIKAIGKRAAVGAYIKKGTKVGVQGIVSTGSYEKEGQKIYTTDFLANNVELLSPKPKSEGSGEQGYYPPNDGPAMGPPSPPEFDDDTPPWM
jgi:single-strand DNA-binding protein